MLTSTHIHRYGILHCFDSYSAIDSLFSGENSDPCWSVSEGNDKFLKNEYWELAVAIAPNGTCVIQTIVFRDKLGYERYKRDEATIFDQKGI